MNILGFDTSTKAASVALLKDDTLVGEILINDKRTHSQKLMPMLESLFKLADITANDIDLLAVCIGPGSFTGLRIAMASVKAMAHAKDLKIVAVDSLESLAFNIADVDKKIIPILDAQGSKVYTASYKSEGSELIKLEEIEVLDIDDLLEKIEKNGEKTILLGEGVYKYREKIENNSLVSIPSPDKNISKASSVCAIALEKYRKNIDIHTHYDILPMYIRKSQAETQYEEKQRKMKEATDK
ncbi:MAG: tRNA (adenosine(37)-N6)-threonylcarbamoyltransferase complex dimerization subunit type 1 TsaB [Peptostreptococcus sp.]|uniref:tRNA (adenosine(37)-N6)-threonylcarbamoyltransferase complex dimerization subunit type 1 TsaB n=1 Tax=Peptostreptococcus sp. TaxID=1262 RepID=UPI002FC5ACA2